MGGRGADYDIPDGNNGGNWSNGIGTKVADTLREALGRKRAPIDMTSAYKDANPNYDASGTYREYTENCQRCVVAYELRRRGYDVTALPTYSGDTMPQARMIGNRKFGRWQGAFKGARPINVGAKNPNGVVSNIRNKMQEFEDGSRGVVSITYKGKRYGHVFNVEQRKGTTYFVDAQSGDRIRAKNFFAITKTAEVNLVRTDSLRVSERAKNLVTSENIYKRRRKKK